MEWSSRENEIRLPSGKTFNNERKNSKTWRLMSKDEIKAIYWTKNWTKRRNNKVERKNWKSQWLTSISKIICKRRLQLIKWTNER